MEHGDRLGHRGDLLRAVLRRGDELLDELDLAQDVLGAPVACQSVQELALGREEEEHHAVDLRKRASRLRQAIADRLHREGRVVLAAREALLLRRGDDAPVLEQRGGAVVVERRDAEDAHQKSV